MLGISYTELLILVGAGIALIGSVFCAPSSFQTAMSFALRNGDRMSWLISPLFARRTKRSPSCRKDRRKGNRKGCITTFYAKEESSLLCRGITHKQGAALAHTAITFNNAASCLESLQLHLRCSCMRSYRLAYVSCGRYKASYAVALTSLTQGMLLPARVASHLAPPSPQMLQYV